ncbi:MAG TPA: S8 family serine peptidase [Candidatus Limnocylindria bacterium]
MPRAPRRSRLLTLLAAFALLAGSVALPVPVAGAPGSVRLVVTFRPGTPGAVARQLARGGGEVVSRIDALRVRVVKVPAAATDQVLAAWQRDPNVERVEVEGTLAATWIPPDPLWPMQWEKPQVRAPRAWNLERGTYHTVVAVVDTGVQLNHPDVSTRMVEGYDFVNHDRRPSDDNGHGTAVAGIIAASTNSLGVAGMCAKCKIMPIKALDANGIGMWTVAAKAIMWAADHHADVINLSFGGPTGGSTLGDAIAYARAKGAVVIGAAGNFSSQQLFYPAAFPGVISVAASSEWDLRYSWSDYSTSWVDVTAPGCTTSTKRGSSYGGFCGTSAATPMVAGIAALVDSAKPGISRAQIESILTSATIRTPWAFTRFGRIDAYKAVYRAIHGFWPTTPQLLPTAPLLVPADDVTLLAGNQVGYRFDAYGAMIRGRAAELDEDAAAHASKESAIPGRKGTFLYLIDGDLAGYWVPESDYAFLTPDATPTPKPSPTPTPSPTGH